MSQLSNQIRLRIFSLKVFYLGFPLHIKKRQKSHFLGIIDKIKIHDTGWKAKILSQNAQATLIKSSLQTIPSYLMSSFQIAKHSRQQIDVELKDYFWGVTTYHNSKNYLYLNAWESLCKPNGSMELQNLERANTPSIDWMDKVQLWCCHNKDIDIVPYFLFKLKRTLPTHRLQWKQRPLTLPAP